MRIELVSTDEGEFQPLGVAGPATYLRKHGIHVDTIDLSKTPRDLGTADLTAFSVPIFAAIDSTVKQARKLRRGGYDGPLLFYNQYATVQPETFLLDEHCYVIMGEYEEVLCDVAAAWHRSGSLDSIAHLRSRGSPVSSKALKRERFLAPDRSSLPELKHYARTVSGALIGNVETMRGCAHACTYCSVYAAYNRRVVKIEEGVIQQDIDQVVAMGAAHITFVDADFFSTGKRGIGVIETMKARHSQLSFDITCRLDDILRYRESIPKLRDWGCTEVTTAVEFPSDRVLTAVSKRMTLQQTYDGIRFCHSIGLKLKPTFITYSPWVNKKDIESMERFIDELGLGDQIDSLQRETRLLLYKGSPLLNTAALTGVDLIERDTYFDWRHPDAAMDEAYQNVATPAAAGRKRCCIKG